MLVHTRYKAAIITESLWSAKDAETYGGNLTNYVSYQLDGEYTGYSVKSVQAAKIAITKKLREK